MVNRTIYNLKTLQIQPTNRLYLKGLLTYRTFQFSMSSRCFHPKIIEATFITSVLRFSPANLISRLRLPIRGTKNPRADLLIPTRPLRPLFVSQLTYRNCADRQLFSYSTGIARSNATTLARQRQGSTGFFTFLRFSFRKTGRTHKEQGVDNTSNNPHSKRFLQKKAHVYNALQNNILHPVFGC